MFTDDSEVLAAFINRPDSGGSKQIQNVGKLIPDYKSQHPRRWSSSRRIKPMNHAAHMGVMRNVYRVLFEDVKGKEHVGELLLFQTLIMNWNRHTDLSVEAMFVFWLVTPDAVLGRYRRFGGKYCPS
jgi:hypothetical protein